jgi:hypothetical protein
LGRCARPRIEPTAPWRGFEDKVAATLQKAAAKIDGERLGVEAAEPVRSGPGGG